MAQAAVAAGPWTGRRSRIAELRRRHAFAREVLDFYGALLAVQQEAFDEARSASPPVAGLIAYVAEMVVPAVLNVSVAAGPAKLRDAVLRRLETVDPRDFVAAWIRGEEQVMVDRYLARASLGPVLEALGPEAAASCVGVRDQRHCPSCGGPPQLSFFALAGEDLAAGGRFLACARCHGSWGYARMTCPCCGEDSSSRLPIFSEEGTSSGERGSVVRGLQGRLPGDSPAEHKAVFPHIRIEACDSCRHYLLNVDLASDPAAVPVVDELAALPLNLYARERGFSKITPNLMGF
ncbi:MAG TPA: formate dehydrogenase accessory protein FdhE [Candidatus Dormibacteraeota bacterium]|nr:formate dehydrogenase accessory protein FdhE [Candidatus Dormibacteraeota bacterium]